jgi:Transcriptional regulator
MDKLQMTQNKILDESLRLFGEKGYFDTTTKEIAKCCQINESTLFRHFPDKETLFRTVIHKFMNQPSEELEAVESKLIYTDCYEDHLTLAFAYLQTIFSNLYIVRILVSKIANMPNIEVEKPFILCNMKIHYHHYLVKAMEHGLVPQGNYDMEEELFVSHIVRLVLDLAAHEQIYTLSDEISFQLKSQIKLWCKTYVDGILIKHC